MTMTFSFLARLVTLGVVLVFVIQGKLPRPEYIFPAIPLIKQFVGVIITRVVAFLQMQLPEMLVVTGRIEVRRILHQVGSNFSLASALLLTHLLERQNRT